MVIATEILLTVMIVMYICTFSYRRKMRKQLNHKKYKLLFVYGMSMFLVDRLPQKLIYKNNQISSALKQLSVRENIDKEKYLYFVEKVSTCLITLFITLIISVTVHCTERMNNSKIKNLARDSNKNISYQLTAQNQKGEKETIYVEVAKKKRTEKEIKTLLKSKEKRLIKKMLADNKVLEHVDKPLNLVSSIGEENILVSWEIDNSNLIGYDGNISDNVSLQGQIVNLTATLTLENVVQSFSFAVNVYPPKEKTDIQSKVQNYVNQSDEYQDNVALPESIGKDPITFYENISNSADFLLLIGIVSTVLIFFLKDRQLKRAVKDREEQLLNDYPEIVSKILLYYGAGLSIISAFENIVREYIKEREKNNRLKRYAYEELEITLTKIKSGVSEATAIIEYGNKCGIHSYIKMANIIVQNLKRGTKEMAFALKNEVTNAIMEKKNRKLKEGAEISTKLLGPMILMLIVAMGVIMVPALLSINI